MVGVELKSDPCSIRIVEETICPGVGTDPARHWIVSFINSVMDAAEPQNLVSFPKM